MSNNLEVVMLKKENIKKQFTSLTEPSLVRFSNAFVNNFLIDKATNEHINIPIDALRILFKISADIRNNQFQSNNTNKHQFDLFEQEFKTEDNSFALFKFKRSDISPNRNTERIKKALAFLTDYKKDWHISYRKDGEAISSYGGLITDPVFSKGSLAFYVPSYWLEQLSHLPQYNNFLYQLAFSVSNYKHLLFAIWLMTIPEKGTTVNFNTFNKRYKLNYATARSLGKDFLKPIRNSLDGKNSVSFNFSVKGELISIVPYKCVNITEGNLDEKTKTIVSISQKTHYWKNRHQLSNEDKKTLALVLKNDPSAKGLLLKGYDLFVKDSRKQKIKSSEIKGIDFMKKFQEFIRIAYLNTSMGEKIPNGYPKIM